MSNQRPVSFNSNATTWDSLKASIQDALFDAQHQRLGLQGKTPTLTVVISRKLLPLDTANKMNALNKLSAKLQRQGVLHSFHCVAPGCSENDAHRIQISI